jgi:hypothetical protein
MKSSEKEKMKDWFRQNLRFEALASKNRIKKFDFKKKKIRTPIYK